MVSGYCYRVYFEDGGDETTNYVGAVLQVGDRINIDDEDWVVTDAKVVSEETWTSRSASAAPRRNRPLTPLVPRPASDLERSSKTPLDAVPR